MTFGVLDLADSSYTDLATYKAESRREYTFKDGVSSAAYDHNYYPLADCYLADINCQTGDAAVLNILTGERTLLTDSLPLTRRSRKRIAASHVLGMAGFCRFPSGALRMTAAALSPVFPPYIIVPMVR